jgi:hypothetical protein
MTDIAIPSNENILRFCNALLTARDDFDLVNQVIAQELADQAEFLHSTYLMVVLRTVVTEFYAPAAARLDHEIGDGFVDTGLAVQGAANEGVDLNH